MQSLSKTKNIIDMLQSPDPEDHIVGMSVLNQWDPQKEIIPLMICFKMGYPNEKGWQEHAPIAITAMKKITKIHVKTGITWQSIFNAVIMKKAPVEYVQFTMDGFAEHLTTLVKRHPHIEGINIILDTKDE